MSESNVKYKMIGTNVPNFFHQHSPKSRTFITKHLPFWRGILLTCLLILLRIVLAEGRMRYQRWMWNIWGLPYGIDVCYLFIKFLLSGIVRRELKSHNGQKRVKLSFQNMIRSVALPGMATGLELGFTNWSLQLLAVPLYTMTRSTTVVFIFGFALLFKLERKLWPLVGIVALISGGLSMFTYRPTALNVFGIVLALLGSASSAFRWTAAQYIMQKSKLGLEHPIDMMYYVQPWMILGTIPVALWFEGTEMYNSIFEVDWTDTWSLLSAIMALFCSGMIAFCLELIEYTILSRTSSLTLSIAGITKTLSIFFSVYGLGLYGISDVNYLGLQICFSGIILYIILRMWTISEEKQEEDKDLGISSKSYLEEDLIPSNKQGISTISDVFNKEKQKYQMLE